MPSCLEKAHSAGRVQENFMYRNFCLKVAVLQYKSEPLTQCKMCGMQMLAGRLIRHREKSRCFKNTEMRLMWKYVEVTSRCVEMGFNLTGKEVDETIEGV